MADKGDIHPVVARILVGRGITSVEDASAFLSPNLSLLHDPFLLLGMEGAASRLAMACSKGETVCVYGDYDVDGITATALLVHFFRAVGIRCFYHIPLRMEEGYGLSRDGMESVAAQGAKVVVSVDCGIRSINEAALCSSLGIDLIITDHHLPDKEIPPAFAVINPQQPGCLFPFKQLAGVGVAFNLMIALRSRLREMGHFRGGEPNLSRYLDLVAMGTIADIVPLVGENRVLVKQGLAELTNSCRVGIRALKEVAGVSGDVGCGAVGFRLAPRLNAAGRLEDAALGVELLLCEEPELARKMAVQLDEANSQRQALERDILDDALKMVRENKNLWQGKSIVLTSAAWHPGVIGIVASRLIDIFHRPTILIAINEGIGRGSGRSIPNFHLHDALSACSEHLLKFGGHKHAAGLSIEESNLEAFSKGFAQVADALLTPEDLVPELSFDSVLQGDDIDLELAETVQALAPFGMGNPEPVFVLEEALVCERRVLRECHLKLRLASGEKSFDAIGFNMGEMTDLPPLINVAFSLQINQWNGRRSVQLKLRDIKGTTNLT